MTDTITLPAAALAAAAEFASRDVTRVSLRGVYFDRLYDGSLVLIATDGYRMAIVRPHGPVAMGEPLFVPSEAIAQLRINKRAGKRGDVLTIDRGAVNRMRVAGGLIVEAEAAAVCFPDWRHVIPRRCPPASAGVGFDMRYLGSFAALGNCAAIYADGDHGPSVLLFPPAGDRPFDALGILMPRPAETDPELPLSAFRWDDIRFPQPAAEG